MRAKILLLLLTALILSNSAQSQKKTQIYVTPMLGAIYYVGDLKDHALPSPRFLRPFYGVDLKFKWKNSFTIGVGWFRGKIVGADQWGLRNPKRDFRFRSNINDFHVLARINPLWWRNKMERLNLVSYRWKPWLIIGGAYFHHNPEIYSSEVGWNYAHPIGTEGQYLGNSRYPRPYKLWTWNIKYGVELEFPINDVWSWQLYSFYNHTFTDYLDDVSKIYPDPQELAEAPNGALIAAYSYQYTDGHLPPAYARRGNPLFRDGYVVTGVSVSYLFRGKPTSRSWTKKPPRCADWRRGRKRFALRKRSRQGVK